MLIKTIYFTAKTVIRGYMNSQAIGDTIRFYRKKSGLTQAMLGQLAEVGKTVIYDIEKGKETVQLNSILKILSVLNIQITLKGPFPMDENQ